jgi:hypothetical protein
MISGVGVAVSSAGGVVTICVVGVAEGWAVAVSVGVLLGRAVLVAVAVCVGVAVSVGVAVGVAVGSNNVSGTRASNCTGSSSGV